MREAPQIDSRSGEKFFHDLARDLKERLDIDADGGDPLAEVRQSTSSATLFYKKLSTTRYCRINEQISTCEQRRLSKK